MEAPASATNPTPAEMVNGMPAKPEAEDAANAGESHAREDHERVAHRAEGQVEQAQDHDQRQRHDDHQPRSARSRFSNWPPHSML